MWGKMNKFNITLIVLIIFMITFSSATQQTLGKYKQNECVELKQICSTCSYNNISYISNPNGTRLLTEIPMIQEGTTYTYNFCSTPDLGEYIVAGYGDIDGTLTTWIYNFEITGNGKENPEGITIVFFSIFFLIALGTMTYSFITSIGHLSLLDFDVLDLSKSMGIYFTVFGAYMISKFYLGNPEIEDFLLWMIEIGAVTHILLPLIFFAISFIVGGLMNKKPYSGGYNG